MFKGACAQNTYKYTEACTSKHTGTHIHILEHTSTLAVLTSISQPTHVHVHIGPQLHNYICTCTNVYINAYTSEHPYTSVLSHDMHIGSHRSGHTGRHA